MMMQGFQADLDRLREEHEALRARLAGMKVSGEAGITGQEDIPRVIPEERVYEAVFDVIGTKPAPFELYRFSSRLGGGETGGPTLIQEPTASSPSRSQIFRSKPDVSGGGIIFKSAGSSGPVAVEKVQSGMALREEMANISGETEGLVAPPSTPTTGFLPIVQRPAELAALSTATQGTSSEFSERLELVPEAMQAPPVQEMPPKPKTFLLPWSMYDDPDQLINIVAWTINEAMGPIDSIKILITGELQGEESFEGEIALLFGNDLFNAERDQLSQQYPNLVNMIEQSGLTKVPFQVEVRRGETLGWSMRSEFQWPHVNEQLMVVVPSHYQQRWPQQSFESFILRAAPCPVIEFPVKS